MLNSESVKAITDAFSVLTMGTNFQRLLGGLWVTVWIALVSVAFSIILGMLLGMLMTVKNKAVKIICKIYLEFMRIMPQMVLLFIAYYGLTRMFNISLFIIPPIKFQYCYRLILSYLLRSIKMIVLHLHASY